MEIITCHIIYVEYVDVLYLTNICSYCTLDGIGRKELYMESEREIITPLCSLLYAFLVIHHDMHVSIIQGEILNPSELKAALSQEQILQVQVHRFISIK